MEDIIIKLLSQILDPSTPLLLLIIYYIIITISHRVILNQLYSSLHQHYFVDMLHLNWTVSRHCDIRNNLNIIIEVKIRYQVIRIYNLAYSEWTKMMTFLHIKMVKCSVTLHTRASLQIQNEKTFFTWKVTSYCDLASPGRKLWFRFTMSSCGVYHTESSVRRQTAVSACFLNKWLRHFTFAHQRSSWSQGVYLLIQAQFIKDPHVIVFTCVNNSYFNLWKAPQRYTWYIDVTFAAQTLNKGCASVWTLAQRLYNVSRLQDRSARRPTLGVRIWRL